MVHNPIGQQYSDYEYTFVCKVFYKAHSHKSAAKIK